MSVDYKYKLNLITNKYYDKVPEGYYGFDTTSHNRKENKFISPFYLGDVMSLDGHTAKVFENLWQFSKVYPHMVDENGEPTKEFFEWRENGFQDTKAHRYTFKGVKPLYSWWGGEHLGYTEARKRIYIPIYAIKMLTTSDGIRKMKKFLESGNKLALRDFDGYNFKARGLSYEELIDNPNDRMGHAHVIALILERPDIVQMYIDRYLSETGLCKKMNIKVENYLNM